MSKKVTADSLTKGGKFFKNNVLEQTNRKTRKKNSGGKRKTRKGKKSSKSKKRFRKTRSTRQKGGDNVNAKDANG